MDQGLSPADREIVQKLGLDQARPSRRLWRWVLALVLVAAIAGGAAWWWTAADAGPEFRTIAARTGDVVATVTATGTLEPTNQVEVGSEISGRIASVAADFNDRVSTGQVLATLDTDQLEAKVRQSEAGLLTAEAGVREAMASVDEMQAKSRRLRALARRDFTSQQDLEVAEAGAARADAALASARAQVSVAEAVLEADRTTLGKAAIRSPIDGVVIGRTVEAGQTVAASFQTPVLFTLAEDLTKMELHLDIDEADIGQVKEGQEATFRVDAYPNRDFAAEIVSIRYAPREVQGVVSYEAILSVNNDALLLRPGMTATADIVTARRDDALLVPSGALRFTPPEVSGSGAVSEDGPGANGASREGETVWTLRDGEPVAIAVRTGLTDGRWTAIESVESEDVESTAGEGALAVTPGLPLLVDVVSPERG